MIIKLLPTTGKNSFIFDLKSQNQTALPILIPDAKSAYSADKTQIVASILDGQIEKFYIVDLGTQKTTKILNPGLDTTSYLNLIFDANSNVFFVSNKKFYEIKN